jgi:hypothetical protein
MLYLISFKCKNKNIKKEVFQRLFRELRKYKQYNVNSYYNFKIIRLDCKTKSRCKNLKSNNIIINLYSDDSEIIYKGGLDINYKLHNIDSILINIMLYLNQHKIIEGLYI